MTNPSVVGKAILTGLENQCTQVNQQLDRGDCFSAGKEAGEPAFDIITTADEFTIAAALDIKLVNADSRARVNRLISLLGDIGLLAGAEHFDSVKFIKRKSAVWCRQSQEKINSINYQECRFSGVVELQAKHINVELVRDSLNAWLRQVEIKEGELSCTSLQPVYNREAMAVEGPGPLLVGLVALGTAILTGGTCSSWAANLGFKVGTTMHFAVQAGFVGLCSQAAASLVANKGDPFKTIESLVSFDTVKSLATSMLSAGVVAKIARGLNIDIIKLSKSDFLGRLEYNLAKNSVGAAVNMSIYGKYEHGAIGGVIDALLSSALSPILDKVDTLTAAADFSKGNQELLRILLAGGVRVAITGRDSIDGILSGIAEEYVAAKCKTVVAEWEREDKIREMAEKTLAEDVLTGKDQASSSSFNKKHVTKNKDDASSSSNSSDVNKCKARERSQRDFSKEEPKYNRDDFISSIFTDPKALDEYEKYLARSGQNIISGYDEPAVTHDMSRDKTSKIVSFMFSTAYAEENNQLTGRINSNIESFWQNYGDNYIELMQEDYYSSLAAMNSFKNFIFNPRTQGFIQTTVGLGQVAVSVSGGIASLGTGIGPIIAASYAGVGVDNIVSGASRVVSGKYQPTLLFQAAKAVGFSDNVASWAELAVNLSPSMPGVAKEVGGIANKGLTKLYDLRKTKNLTFSMATRVESQIIDSRLGSLSNKLDIDKLNMLANNPEASFFLDKTTGNINIIQKIEEDMLRITVPRDSFKIISVGPIRERNIINSIKNGRFIPINNSETLKDINIKVKP